MCSYHMSELMHTVIERDNLNTREEARGDIYYIMEQSIFYLVQKMRETDDIRVTRVCGS